MLWSRMANRFTPNVLRFVATWPFVSNLDTADLEEWFGEREYANSQRKHEIKLGEAR